MDIGDLLMEASFSGDNFICEITHDLIICTHLYKWSSVGILPLAENEARGCHYHKIEFRKRKWLGVYY